ncbi:MAG: alpha/beta hydrolase [Parasphingopyxis sp.]|uniref:alpha/beta hydrolase n=1 Tax=Parasphingopyxis sp. TaxID=1920299 RepID=UPI0032EBA23C
MRGIGALLLDRLNGALHGLAGAAMILVFAGVTAGAGHAADRYVTVTTTTVETIEYWDDGSGPVDDFDDDWGEGWVTETVYYEGGAAQASDAIASYGPFNVISADRVELVGDTDSYSPGEFRRLLADFPNIRRIDIVECGGTVDDNANLQLARMIRRAGIATHLPARGSARSGGVELFLAGVSRTAEPGAELIVHSWRDNFGREAGDYAASDAVHRPYLDFYREVGMAPERARAFYALTNSVPNSSQRQLTLTELASFGLLN